MATGIAEHRQGVDHAPTGMLGHLACEFIPGGTVRMRRIDASMLAIGVLTWMVAGAIAGAVGYGVLYGLCYVGMAVYRVL